MLLRKTSIIVVLALFLVALTGTQALAELRIDDFHINNLDDYGVVGGGTGFDGGQWFEYAPDLTPPGGYLQTLPWHNQWFYDDPLMPGGKRVKLILDWSTEFWDMDITINWSNEMWGDEFRPPLPGEDMFIERLPAIRMSRNNGFEIPEYLNGLVLDMWVDESGGMPVGHLETDWFYLPTDYNPVWVSVDVRGYYDELPGSAPLTGTILHECQPVPLPAAVWLFASGLIGIVGIRRKTRR